ncbi:MAG: peptidoglycan DD-metalloendopeptidase family protein [Deltaproteobacteria bacterium]|nr:peptidoglycan DD-metalloendopeptidase family protein [Deltaproteobacteria bacterium]
MAQWCQRLDGQVGRGDTFSSALNQHDLAPGQVGALVEALRGTMDFRHCRPGERYELLVGPDSRVWSFEYQKTPLLSYLVERQQGRLRARESMQEAEIDSSEIGLRISGSLYASLERAGETAALVVMIVDIFAWDIDFYIDTHPDDTIRLIVEKLRLEGRFVRYGRILAAEYAGDVGVHRAFRYATADGEDGFYDEQGGSLRKAFLKTPLKFARVSSGFGRRVHPILGFNKMHNGIDFAAPIGTPVWAPADGTVTFAGRKGASGRMVSVRHANGYATVYCHLHRIARGVRGGVRLRQKQLIGTVGNTGRSTGPHLHYGMKRNGRWVNPLRQKFPPARPVPAGELDAYRSAIAPLQKRLDSIQVPPASRELASDSPEAG